MIQALIIEDELASQELLGAILHDFCPALKVVGVANSFEMGEERIRSLQPDLVFLDIHIGSQNGFDLLDMMGEREFKVIFTTAYDAYALKAFKYEAVDYILKPYTPKDVIGAVQRIQDKFDESHAFKHLEQVIKNTLHQKDTNKISFPTSEGLSVFRLDNITRIEGSGAYCKIYSTDAKALMISKSLKEVEIMLHDNLFFRTHDSHIINLRHVRAFKKEDGGVVVLENNDQVPVSRRKKNEFLERMTTNGI